MLSTTKPYQGLTGGITITMSLMLLILSLGAAVYTANSTLLDAKITAANFRKSQAYLAAESGIEYALVYLRLNPEFLGVINLINSDKFSVEVTAIVDPDGVEFSVAANPNIKFRTITSTGFSIDQTNTSTWHANQEITLVAYRRPIANLPRAALTTSGTLTIDAHLKVGANPNGGGIGIPVSIWSSASVNINGSGATCDLVSFDDPHPMGCDMAFYSNNTSLGTDIIDNDPLMPSDLLLHTFGYSFDDAVQLKTTAKQQLDDCTSLTQASTGFYWVLGDCQLNASVGTALNPVIIVVENGSIELDGNYRLHGLVYLHYSDSSVSPPIISIDGTAAIHGAVIVEGDAHITSSRLEIRYQPAILATITEGTHPQFSSINVMHGSWKDF